MIDGTPKYASIIYKVSGDVPLNNVIESVCYHLEKIHWYYIYAKRGILNIIMSQKEDIKKRKETSITITTVYKKGFHHPNGYTTKSNSQRVLQNKIKYSVFSYHL